MLRQLIVDHRRYVVYFKCEGGVELALKNLAEMCTTFLINGSCNLAACHSSSLRPKQVCVDHFDHCDVLIFNKSTDNAKPHSI